MTHDEMIAVIAAHRDGKKIERLPKGHSYWQDLADLVWDFQRNDYRVAPEPKLRPFTPEEAMQLVGAVAVHPAGDRGTLDLCRDSSDQVYVSGQGFNRLAALLKDGWRWKWPHEDDSQLRPFGKAEV